MRILRMTVLGLAAYGGYVLWNQYGRQVAAVVRGDEANADSRVYSRSELTVTEWAVGSDDPVAQAAAILRDDHDPPRTRGRRRRGLSP